MNSMVDEQRNESARRPHAGSGTPVPTAALANRSPRIRLIAVPRAGQRLSASGMVGGVLPGMILGLVVGLLTGSFVAAAIVGTVAVIVGGVLGARLARATPVDVDNPAIS